MIAARGQATPPTGKQVFNLLLHKLHNSHTNSKPQKHLKTLLDKFYRHKIQIYSQTSNPSGAFLMTLGRVKYLSSQSF